MTTDLEEYEHISDKAKAILEMLDSFENWEFGCAVSIVVQWWVRTKIAEDRRQAFLDKFYQSITRHFGNVH